MIQLFNDNMFNTLKDLDSQSIDLLLTDFPYGTLNKRNVWDTIIDYPTFWKQVDRICKPTCAIISTAAQPFTSVLISSNYNDFKYTMVWEKSKATGYLNAKKQPLRAHEDIVVFYKKPPTYNPQMTQGTPYDKGRAVRDTESYGVQTKEIHVKNDTGLRYPRSVLYFKTAEGEGKYHPTQKPISLYEYLINTYSNENDIVLDPCMGSGTTGVACMNTDRNFIGIEMDENYYRIAEERITNTVSVVKVAQEYSNPLLDALIIRR
jgi:site-specific DNA-methyltransferase (adenine-specific)